MTAEHRDDETVSIELLSGKANVLSELSFLAGHGGPGKFRGLLTSGDNRPNLQHYPFFLGGILVVEAQLEELGKTPPDMGERFIQHLVMSRLQEGRLITDEEIAGIREQIAQGRLSQQLAVLAGSDDQQEMVVDINLLPPEFSGRRTPLAEFTALYSKRSSQEDIMENKRLMLAHWHALASDLEVLYGEVNLRAALLAELLLDPPFLETIVFGQNLDETARRRHAAYFNEVLGFAQKFAPATHFNNFQEATQAHQVGWIEEEQPPPVSDFDREYLGEVYNLAKKMLAEDFEIDEVYGLLGKTILRRSRFFNLEKIGHQVVLVPVKPESLTFADIGGYDEQTQFYRRLLEHIENCSPILADLRIILAAGKPGTGKSLGVTAFVNALPDHGRALFLDHSDPLAEYEKALELARFHPELEVFAVIEDIDTLAGSRSSFATGFFLEIDSAIPEAMPTNLHILATTNRPDVIDSAITRPGRTAKVLVYTDGPDTATRKRIIEIQACRQKLDLDQPTLELIGQKTKGLTPDEIRHIIWSLIFNNITQPTEVDIDGFVAEIQQRHQAKGSK